MTRGLACRGSGVRAYLAGDTAGLRLTFAAVDRAGASGARLVLAGEGAARFGAGDAAVAGAYARFGAGDAGRELAGNDRLALLAVPAAPACARRCARSHTSAWTAAASRSATIVGRHASRACEQRLHKWPK